MTWTMSSTRSWVDKLRPKLEHKIVESKRSGKSVLVPTPTLLAEQIRKVSKGKLTTIAQLRVELAERTGAESTCPMTTGICLSIVAGAAEEQMANSERPIAPYWRVVETDGGLRERNPAGAEAQARHLRREGHRLARAGAKGLRVEGFGGR